MKPPARSMNRSARQSSVRGGLATALLVAGFVATTTFTSSSAAAGGPAGLQIDLDTSAGRINGQTSATINGVTIEFVGFVEGDTIARFRVLGDLILGAEDRLVAFGVRGASILVADDVFIDPDAEIDASSGLLQPGPGGGSQATGGAGGTGGPGIDGSTLVGVGGIIGTPGLGGAAGFGGFNGAAPLTGPTSGLPPLPRYSYTSDSAPGQPGVNAPGGGGPSRELIGIQGSNGSGGARGSNGGGGAGGASQGGNGQNGGDGTNGSAGGDGGNGANGLVGNGGLNTGTGPLISGGGGGSGGTGGLGGGGGGALEIVALGTIWMDGTVLARGGDGRAGAGSGSVGFGSLANSAQDGLNGNDSNDEGGDGGDGGDGGRGGRGGCGGSGGTGAFGGGGAAGTIKLSATALTGAGSIDLRPGNVGMAGTGGAGRVLLGASGPNDLVAEILGDPGAELLEGPVEASPYLFDSPIESPYIGGLDDGADLYGFVTLDADVLDQVLDGVPAGAGLVLRRLDAMPAGFVSDDANFDAIVIVNAGDETVTGVGYGANSLSMTRFVLRRGTVNNPAFGGDGEVYAADLAPGAAWITTVPEDVLVMNIFGNGTLVPIEVLEDGEFALLDSVSVCPADLDGDGVVAFGDLTLVLADWGSDGTGNGTDLDGDGTVGLTDLLTVLNAWGSCD